MQVEVVPGITSALAAAAYAGVPVTHRGLSTSVTIVTGHVGDPSAPGVWTGRRSPRLAGTIVVLMGMATRDEISRRLVEGGRAPSTPVVGGRVGDHREAAHGPHDARRARRGASSKRPRRSSSARSRASTSAWLERPPLDGLDSGRDASCRTSRLLCRSLFGAAGASVVSLPCIAVERSTRRGEALDAGSREVSGIRLGRVHFCQRRRRILSPARRCARLAGVKLAAVGAATASLLRQGIWLRIWWPEIPSAAGLVDAMGSPSGAGAGCCSAGPQTPCRRSQRACARRGGPSTRSRRTARSWPAPDDGATPEAVEQARGADAVVFASPSAVRGFVVAARSEASAARRCVHRSRRPLKRHASPASSTVFVADEASDAGLVARGR